VIHIHLAGINLSKAMRVDCIWRTISLPVIPARR
jgi:hypothetical protein